MADSDITISAYLDRWLDAHRLQVEASTWDS
jgi:hypothetical protein